MRFLVAALAALALTACFGAPGEPLNDNRVPPPAGDDRDELSAEEQVRLAMIEEIALAMGEAADVSLDAADAGLSRDQAAAALAATHAAEVAAMVQQRAGEVVKVLEENNAGNDCGTGSSNTTSSDGVTDDDVNDAVAAAMCAANAAQEVSDSLVPGEPTTECVCGVCTETPGAIDEAALASAIETVTAAGEACGDSEDVLTDGNNTSI